MQENEQQFQVKSGTIPSGDILVYEYGCRVDKDALPHIERQIHLSRGLYNNLVALMRDTVQALQEFMIDKAGEGAKQIKSEIDTLTVEFDAAKAKDDEPEMRRIAEIRRGKWRELNAALKEVRKIHRSEIQDRFLSKIGKKSTCATYILRCQAVQEGLGWATANVVLDSALLAFKKSFATGRLPRFAKGAEIRQDCLTLQFTLAGGVPSSSILAGKIGECVMTANSSGKRSYGKFKFRMGSAKSDAYATGTWQYHRPLPEGSTIALARLVRRRLGMKVNWSIQLLVKTKAPVHIETSNRQPLCAVHFGWSADVNGRRVAAIADSAEPSASTILALPVEIEEGLSRAADIQSNRDMKRNEIAAQVKLISVPDNANPVLIEMLDKLKKLRPQYVSSSRLHYLCRLLREEGCLPKWLDEWRKDDKLQWQAQAHIARRARNTRKTFYREVAIGLARRYDTIAIEPLNLAEAALKVDESTGEKTSFIKKARAGRVVAALYEFESALRWAAAKAKCAVLDIKAPTAAQCAICTGATQAVENDNQTLICTKCGAVLDRKQNGAARAWQLVQSVREDAVTTFWVDHHTKHQETLAKRAEKLTKVQTARTQGLGRKRAAEDGENANL